MAKSLLNLKRTRLSKEERLAETTVSVEESGVVVLASTPEKEEEAESFFESGSPIVVHIEDNGPIE